MLVSNNIQRDSRVRKEAQSLVDAGHRVHILGFGKTYPNNIADCGFSFDLVSPTYKGKPLMPAWGQEHVWYPIRVLTNKTVTAWRTRQWLRQDWGGYNQQVARPEMMTRVLPFRPDVVHAHDLDTLYAANMIAQREGAQLVYDSHELYLALHFLDENLRPEFAQVEKEIFPQVDGFVTVSPEVGEYLVKKYQSDLEPVIIYNGSTSIVDHVEAVGSPVRMLFQGAFAHDRNNCELIEAMVLLRGMATLSLQGWGEDEENYRELIVKNNLEDTVFLVPPCQPYEVMESASHYDVGIINYKRTDENFAHTLPNKLFDYMCAGLAVAATDLPPIKHVIDKAECGVTYSQKDVENTARALLKLVERPDEIVEMKNASRKAAPQYAWPEQARKLCALYKELAQNSSNRGVQ